MQCTGHVEQRRGCVCERQQQQEHVGEVSQETVVLDGHQQQAEEAVGRRFPWGEFEAGPAARLLRVFVDIKGSRQGLAG